MNLSKDILYRSISFKRIIKALAIFIVAITVIFYWAEWIAYETAEDSGEELSESDDAKDELVCNVAGIEIRGTIVTYIPKNNADEGEEQTADMTSSEDIVATLEQLATDDSYKGLVVEVDSYGGSPVAAEEIATALKKIDKPKVAIIRERGTSAAYWAASGADIIMASKNSDVGSIGVTFSYVDNARNNEQEGLTYNQLSSGILKDAGDPDKLLTAVERKVFERDLAIVHENFVSAIADNRKLDVDVVQKLADGSSMLGEMAAANKLIDKIGGLEEAKSYLKEKIGVDPVICW